MNLRVRRGRDRRRTARSGEERDGECATQRGGEAEIGGGQRRIDETSSSSPDLRARRTNGGEGKDDEAESRRRGEALVRER
ncbi:hypothetical protein U1Q18_050751 [Sarracenia purpurea var. burkii]